MLYEVRRNVGLEICTRSGEGLRGGEARGGNWRGLEGERRWETDGLAEVALTSTDLLADLRPLLSWNLDTHVVYVW